MSQDTFSVLEASPTYAGNFQCIGAACEDTCCGSWDIPLDKLTYLKYRQLPAGALATLVAHFVSAYNGSPHDGLYGVILRTPDGSCPFFGQDRLCRLQEQHGAGFLSSTCSIYPRSLAVVDGGLEGSLSLSCPEAARQVLLRDNATQVEGDLFSGEFRVDNTFSPRDRPGLPVSFLAIRALVLNLIRDRSRPVWQRLLLVAILCGRLDKVLSEGADQAIEVLNHFRDTIGSGNSSELDQLSPGLADRLGVAIALSHQRCHERDCDQRFKEVFWDFIEGIGSADSPGPESDLRRFRLATDHYIEPLVTSFPFILENYLINYVYQHLFPFGRAGNDRLVEHTLSEEALLLVVQYSWMTTLLIGVAARHGSAFGFEHIVTVVQSFSRAVEHSPQVLEQALDLVGSRELDTLSGIAKLLRR